METPTIIRQTKSYLLVKVPLPSKRGGHFEPMQKNGKMTTAEKRLWRIIKEGEQDLQKGRTVTAPSIKEALRRYEKRKWD